MNFPLFIAKRIYSNNDTRKKVSRPAIAIAVAGIAIGLAVMMLTISVILGFKHTIQDKVIGFGGHINVANFMSQMSANDYPIQMDDSVVDVIKKIPGVAHVERYAYKQGILKTDNDFLGVMFKGVGPDWDSTFIKQNLVEGCIPSFSDSLSTNKMLVSQTQAKKLGLKLGNKIFAYFIDDYGVRLRRLTVSGIYQTNLAQYDDAICFADIYTIIKLNGWETDQASGAEIMVDRFADLDIVASTFVKRINKTQDHYGETFSSQTIRESNPQIFNWLDLLDLNVWIIIALMVIVSSVTMISGLLIIILERTQMIGVMKALGATNTTIRRIFLWFSAFTIGRGLIIGNAVALMLLFVQREFEIIKLDPTVYYIQAVPVEFDLPLFLILNAFTFVICLLVLILPSYLISIISPTRSIQYE